MNIIKSSKTNNVKALDEFQLIIGMSVADALTVQYKML